MAKSNAKFITGTCIYAFLILFFIAMSAWIIQDNLGNATMLIVGIVPAAFAVVFGFSLYRFIKKTIEERRISKPQSKFKFGFKQAVFLIIFILSFMPFVLPLFDHGLNTKDHSIYNPTWSGCSDLKDHLEKDLGYNVQGIQSSLSTTMRNNDTYKIIVMLGPNRFYNPVYDLAFYLDFFNTGGSLLICDDKGSTNYLMMEMSLMTSFKTPFVEFPKGDLADNASYIPGKDPYYPVIQNFASHPTTAGVSKVALNYASAIISYGTIISTLMAGSGGGGGGGSLGTELITIGSTSASYSFVDMNKDRYYDPAVDVWDSSIIMEFLKMFINLSPEDEAELVAYVSAVLLGAQPKTVFGAQNLDHGRLFVAGDASMFNNQLLNDPAFDNKLFADNIFSWLSSDGTTNYPPENVTVYFDEVHIRPENLQEFSSTYIYGMFIGYVNWLSSSAILAWIYPFMALYTLSRWLPEDPEKVAKRTRISS
jgi:hypothetical protein